MTATDREDKRMSKLKSDRYGLLAMLLAVSVGSAMIGLVSRTNRAATSLTHPPSPPGQSDRKLLEIRRFENEPYLLGSLRVKGEKIAPGQEFSARSLAEKHGGHAEDWLEDLQFIIENQSNKQVTFIRVELDFREAVVNGRFMVYNQLTRGVPPQVSEHGLRQHEPLALNPGDKLTFTLSAQEMASIKEFLALGKFQLGDLNRATMRIGEMVFDDNMRWAGGHYYRPSPDAHGHYQRVD
jgi:hypothetical protein